MPKIVCSSSKCGLGAKVMKNWDPFVSIPEFAIDTIPLLLCLRSGWIESLKCFESLNADWPPLPVPSGSPP